MKLTYEFRNDYPITANIENIDILNNLTKDIEKSINANVINEEDYTNIIGRFDYRTGLAYVGRDILKPLSTKDEIDIFIEILENYIKLLFYNGNVDIAKIYENNQRYKDTITFLEVMNYRPFCYVPLFMNSITLIQKNLDKTIKLYLSYKIPEYLRKNDIPYYSIKVRKFKGLQDEKSQTNINDIFITKHNIIKHNITLGKCIREIIQNELN